MTLMECLHVLLENKMIYLFYKKIKNIWYDICDCIKKKWKPR